MSEANSFRNLLRRIFRIKQPSPGFSAKVSIKAHQVAFMASDPDRAHFINIVRMVSPNLPPDYGNEFELDSEYYFRNTKVGDIIDVVLEINPYWHEGVSPTRRLRLVSENTE